MDIHRLFVFMKVYELGSLSRSAEVVYLSQPTVSGHIKTLEEELNTKLFDRLGRGVAPTESADLLYEYAKNIVDLRDKAIEAIAELSGQVKGKLNVGGSTIPGHYLFPHILTKMNKLYPDLKIRLTVADTWTIARQIETGDLAIGLVGARFDNPRLSEQPCGHDKLIMVAPGDASYAKNRNISPGELIKIPFILREPGSGSRMVAGMALEEINIKYSDLNVVAELGSSQAVRQAILFGLGASILSSYAVEEDLNTGKMVELNVANLNMHREFNLITRAGRSISPGGKRLMELLKEENEDERF